MRRHFAYPVNLGFGFVGVNGSATAQKKVYFLTPATRPNKKTFAVV